MAARPALTDPSRPTLVGIRPVDRSQRLRAGAHFVPRDAAATAENDEGYVTSVAFSPSLGHWIGLGLLSRGPERHGEVIRAADPIRDGDMLVEVCAPCFIDPEGARLRVGFRSFGVTAVCEHAVAFRAMLSPPVIPGERRRREVRGPESNDVHPDRTSAEFTRVPAFAGMTACGISWPSLQAHRGDRDAPPTSPRVRRLPASPSPAGSAGRTARRA